MELSTMLTIAAGACGGGIGAWVALRVEVAIARRVAEDAKSIGESAHDRMTDHLERHHVKA